ncbi:hypothetical protein C5167_035382 [Papaver somniferum]|uniref:Bet v I/Major latex protein domain-containing protein n=1 Tax=Papaver somniferum TaxID=3469 RepID=A0A4Y7KJ19_PAPSO|nr:MLP-like protein 423 [Papaver somniferum]RZC72181.1 hypothetical protein C5167_035382 [Papaver somniferum]
MAKIGMVESFLRLWLLTLVVIGMSKIVGAQVETELKCSADKFYNLFRHNIMLLPTIFPQFYKSVKIVKGDGKSSVGNIREWQYVTPGASSKVISVKEIVKSVDEDNRSITFSVLGGDLMTQYKTFDIIMTVTPKDVDNIEESGSKVKWWIQYEKRTEDVHSPDAHIQVAAAITKELGHYLLQ